MNFKELERYLIGEAWTSKETYANLETLCDFGSRFAGSPSNCAARDFILGKFKAYGLDSPHLDPFDYLVWTRGTCELKMVVPIQQAMRSAISLVYSPNATNLRAQVVDCGIGSEEDFAKKKPGELKGKIVMVTTANPETGRTIHRREKYGRAVNAGAVGFIYVNHKPGMLAETGSLRPGKLAEIPAIGICYEEGWALARQCKRGEIVVEMNIQNRAEPGQGNHVLGSIPGQTNETILVGAHFDGHDIAQGAIDDGTGTVVILELARILASLQGQFKRTIQLISFDAEELGVLGSQLFANKHANEFGNIALMVNLDGAVGPVSSHGFETSGLKDTEAVLRSYTKDFGYPLGFKNRVVTASDNFPFFMLGIPSICMYAHAENPAMGRGFTHTIADTLDKVAEVDIKAPVMTIARMLVRLANHEGSLGAHRQPDEIKEILIDQGLEHPLRAQDKWPF